MNCYGSGFITIINYASTSIPGPSVEFMVSETDSIMETENNDLMVTEVI